MAKATSHLSWPPRDHHTGPMTTPRPGVPLPQVTVGFILTLACVGTSSCAVRSSLQETKPFIAGHSEPVKRPTPAIMILSKNPDNGGLQLACSAVLIHAELALTAAHCVVEGEESLRPIEGANLPLAHGLVFGFANHVSDLGTQAWVQKRLIPPAKDGIALPPKSQFENPNFSNLDRMQYGAGDIALVKLASRAPDTYPVARLPKISIAQELEQKPQRKLVLTLLGFGPTERSKTDAGILRQGLLHVIKSENAGSFWVADLQDDTKTAPCPGDSGGGLFLEQPQGTNRHYVLAGLASLIVTTQDCSNSPALITDVGAYTKWIEDTAAKDFGIKMPATPDDI